MSKYWLMTKDWIFPDYETCRHAGCISINSDYLNRGWRLRYEHEKNCCSVIHLLKLFDVEEVALMTVHFFFFFKDFKIMFLCFLKWHSLSLSRKSKGFYLWRVEVKVDRKSLGISERLLIFFKCTIVCFISGSKWIQHFWGDFQSDFYSLRILSL